MKLSPAMEDALKGAAMHGGYWLQCDYRTVLALERRGLSNGYCLTPAGIAERERLLK